MWPYTLKRYILILFGLLPTIGISEGLPTQNPSEGRWQRPCPGGSAQFSSSVNVTGPVGSAGLSVGSVMVLWEKITQEILPTAERVKQRFLRDRFKELAMRELLNSDRVTLPTLTRYLSNPQVTLEGNDEISAEMLEEWILNSAGKLRRIAAHLNSAKEGHSQHERNSFHQHYTMVEEHMYWIMCKLEIILAQLAPPQKEPGERIPEGHVPVEESASRILRDINDYLILRDYCNYLRAFANAVYSIIQIRTPGILE